MDLFIAIVVFGITGMAGTGIGILWIRLCKKHNWRGWYIE